MGFIVYVKTMEERTLTVRVQANETVEGLKLRIQNIDGGHLDDMSIIFNGRHLEDSRYLRDYGIQNESVVYLFRLRLSGAVPHIKVGGMGNKNSRNRSREELADFNGPVCTVL